MPGIHRFREREALKAIGRYRRLEVAFPKSEWKPEDGPALWWSFPVEELPYIGQPIDEAFPDHCTHWTPLIVPKVGAQ